MRKIPQARPDKPTGLRPAAQHHPNEALATLSMATVPDFSAGDSVTVDVSECGLVVKPVNQRREPLIYTESELLAGLTPETAHADELAHLTDVEFGD